MLEKNSVQRAIGASQYADVTFASAEELQTLHFNDYAFDYVFDALPPLIDQDSETCPRRVAMRVAKPGSKYVLYGASQVLQKFDTWLLLAKPNEIINLFEMHKQVTSLKTVIRFDS